MRLEESTQSNEALKKELESIQDNLTTATDEKGHLMAQLNQMRLERDEKAHDLRMARLNLDQLSAQVQETSSRSVTVDKEKAAHLAAIKDLRSSQAQLIKEKDTAQTQLADRNREMTGLRY